MRAERSHPAVRDLVETYARLCIAAPRPCANGSRFVTFASLTYENSYRNGCVAQVISAFYAGVSTASWWRHGHDAAWICAKDALGGVTLDEALHFVRRKTHGDRGDSRDGRCASRAVPRRTRPEAQKGSIQRMAPQLRQMLHVGFEALLELFDQRCHAIEGIADGLGDEVERPSPND